MTLLVNVIGLEFTFTYFNQQCLESLLDIQGKIDKALAGKKRAASLFEKREFALFSLLLFQVSRNVELISFSS